MPYSVSDPLAKYLPPDTRTAKPLEYDWDEATNAIVFTSDFDGDSFEAWSDSLAQYYKQLVVDPDAFFFSPSKEEGFFGFDMFHSDPEITLEAAWLKHEESFENLNSWLSSDVLASLVAEESPAMAGVLRIRP